MNGVRRIAAQRTECGIRSICLHDISRDETRLKDGIELVQLGFFSSSLCCAVLCCRRSSAMDSVINKTSLRPRRYHQRGGNAESSDGKNAQSLPRRKESKLKNILVVSTEATAVAFVVSIPPLTLFVQP